MTMKTQDLLTVATKTVAENLLFRLRMDKALTERGYIKEGAYIPVRQNIGTSSRPTPVTLETSDEIKQGFYSGRLANVGPCVTRVELSTLSTERRLNPFKKFKEQVPTLGTDCDGDSKVMTDVLSLKDPILRGKVTTNDGKTWLFTFKMSELEELASNPFTRSDVLDKLVKLLPENNSLLSLTMKGQMMIRIQTLLSDSKIFIGVPSEPYKEKDRMKVLEKVRNVIREVEYNACETLVGGHELLERDLQQYTLYENVMFMLNLPITLRKVSDSNYFTIETRIPHLVRTQVSRGGTKVTMTIQYTSIAEINAYAINDENCLKIINNHYDRLYATHMSIDSFKEILTKNIENDKFIFDKQVEFNSRMRGIELDKSADKPILRAFDEIIKTILEGATKDSK